MEEFQENFKCDVCGNSDFSLVYNFTLRFHRVNFSDDLIYDRRIEEVFVCTGCGKRYTKADIEDGLAGLKRQWREKRAQSG